MHTPRPAGARAARPAALLLAAAVVSAGAPRPAAAQTASAAAPADASAAVLALDLPAQPLADALAALSRQSGVAITADPGVLAGRTARALRGSYALREALGRLLTGSGLVAVATADGGLVLRERAASAGTARLAEVAVQGVNTSRAVTLGEASLGVLGARALTETPFSVSVLGLGLIQSQQASYLGDYVKNDPSVVVSNVPVGFVSLRGFNAGTDGFLFDGVPGHAGLTDGRGAIESIDRVEVLKGPTSFLYGVGAASSLGGTFNYLPKRAPASPVRDVDVNFAGRSLFGVGVDLGDRLGADRRFGYRVNVAYKNGEQATAGYGWRHAVGTVGLDWRATDRLALTGNYEYARNDLPRLQPFFSLSPGLPVPEVPDASRNIAQPWDDFRTRSSNAYLRADYTLPGGWSVTAKTLYNVEARPGVLNARFGVVSDSAGSVLLFGDQYRSSNHTGSVQASVQGRAATWGAVHQLSAGATGMRDRAYLSASDSSVGVFATSLYEPAASPRPADIPRVFGGSGRTEVGGAYVSDLVTLDAHWSLLAGVRRGKVETRNYDVRTGAELEGGTTLWATTPTAALMYNPTRAALVYANYAEGLEQGGVAPQGTVNQNRQLPGLRTRQVELGAKYGLGAATLAAALFELRRPQEFVDAASNTYVQRGRQRHRGAELTLAGDVTPALSVVAGAMRLDPRALVTGDAATQGRRPVGVPNTTGNLWARYRLDGVLGGAPGLSVQAGAYYTGAQYLDAANTQRLPAATRVDAGAGYEARLGARQVDYLLSVENVADRDYWTGGLSGLLVLSNPRTVKLTSRVHF